MDQHKAEQSRHDGRECGDNGKVGDCRILQPGKLGNVIDADAPRMPMVNKAGQVLRGGSSFSPRQASIANSVRATIV